MPSSNNINIESPLSRGQFQPDSPVSTISSCSSRHAASNRPPSGRSTPNRPPSGRSSNSHKMSNRSDRSSYPPCNASRHFDFRNGSPTFSPRGIPTSYYWNDARDDSDQESDLASDITGDSIHDDNDKGDSGGTQNAQQMITHNDNNEEEIELFPSAFLLEDTPKARVGKKNTEVLRGSHGSWAAVIAGPPGADSGKDKKAGNAGTDAAKDRNHKAHDTENAQNAQNEEFKENGKGSWDVNRNFSFTDKNNNPHKDESGPLGRDGRNEQDELHNNESSSITTTSTRTSFWDRFRGNKKHQHPHHYPQHHTAIFNHGNVNRAHAANNRANHFGTNNDFSYDEESLKEMGENDFFALEVGLMFSADDGDTMTFAPTPSICATLTMESDNMNHINSHSSSYEEDGRNGVGLDSYLNHHRHYHPQNTVRRDNRADTVMIADKVQAGGEDESTTNHEDGSTVDDNGSSSFYENYKKYLPSFSRSRSNSFESSTASSKSTFRDDFGNKIPNNAKFILGRHHGHGHHGYPIQPMNYSSNSAWNQHVHNNQVFPTVHPQGASVGGGGAAYAGGATGVYPYPHHDPQELQGLEKRLKDIASHLSLHDKDKQGSTNGKQNDADDGNTNGNNHTTTHGTQVNIPALARRLRDFQFAREKRRKRYGNARPWGILGLYDHLAGVRVDVEWAEDAAWRRNHGMPYLTWAEFESTKSSSGLNRPFFTFFIVSACTAMLFASLLANGWRFEPLSINPMIGPSSETLLRLGAKDSYLIVVQSEIWRLASPMVLHAGVIHYILNTFALFFVGRAIEQVHGFFPSLIQFVVPAVGGTILSAIFLPEYITVGASGGIFGLIGACVSDIAMNWNLLFHEFVNERGTRISHAKVLAVLFIDIVINCVIGLTPFVDNFTHLGGMILGFLCGLSTIQNPISPRFFGDNRHYLHKCKVLLFRSFGLVVSMAGIIASSLFLFMYTDGTTNPCPSCSALSCLAFPPWNGKNDKWWYCDDCKQATAEGTLNSTTNLFVELNINCPDGSMENVPMDPLWPQDELGLEALLPSLCREHCL